MNKYIQYITSLSCEKEKPEFLLGDGFAFAKVGAFLGGHTIRTEQFYHIVLPHTPPPVLVENGKPFYFRRYQCILLPPEQEFKLIGSFSLCPTYEYLLVQKQIVEQIVKNFYGALLSLDILRRNVQAQTLDILKQIETELREKRAGYQAVARYYLSLLVSFILRGAQADLSDASRKDGIAQACEYIAGYYNTDIKVDELAGIANISLYHFIRRFKKETGHTPHQYIKLFRLQKSAELLVETPLPIGKLAKSCGYLSVAHFSNDFREKYGCTPTAYRKNAQKG